LAARYGNFYYCFFVKSSAVIYRMENFSRREFLKRTASLAAFLLASRSGLSAPKRAETARPFEILVVGDSVVSGQGLQEKNKSYSLVKEWLQKEIFGESREVNLKVKAHSGARISLHADELKNLLAAGDDFNKFYHREINLSFPSIEAQIDAARREYESAESVNLILLSGGITDVTVANIINPFFKEEKMRAQIHQYCREAMRGLLEHATETFPNAAVAVVGYFPMISTKSDANKISKFFLKVVKFPQPLQIAFTNNLSKQLMKILRKKMANRSRIWVEQSNREICEAIGKVNSKLDQPRIFFVKTPITEETCYATKNSMLWQTDEDNLPNDEMYSERKIECRKAFDELNFRDYGRFTNRMCEIMGIGHPNIEGARAYAEAIKNALRANLPVDDRRLSKAKSKR
jgi:hypothetical protein